MFLKTECEVRSLTVGSASSAALVKGSTKPNMDRGPALEPPLQDGQRVMVVHKPGSDRSRSETGFVACHSPISCHSQTPGMEREATKTCGLSASPSQQN
jgi:hypothetical protein